ncbi:MAG: class I SAM-dependent methyltransferase [Bacteroidetes bacterium]|jgi:cyclopropane fatty-acyl-phospholipid synthase-like methyltransferase|nr:class I SAM-dependent methyltransferase [Bacteroidota bacterium]MBT3800381.1 class I SAM-dependent methyltransferase [Bacteroidota bacterium]MBT3933974.1 class I SAM-dependent methyltransferase [Bacteroidota bacterium]MBT4337834.1 class I SAM-dependent methyltransferase [Bacteroidota bacterium]MBT4730070.1 class I SAM-dependent methyltransferase [Bacteroidota bacterium]
MFRIIEKQYRQPKGFLGKIISKLMQRANSYAYDKLVSKLSIQENDQILEIGFGHGLGIQKILAKYNCIITGIDFSSLMYAKSIKRFKKQIDNNKVKLLYGNFLEHTFESNFYDKIYVLNVTYFWTSLEIPFVKIRNLLKENGCFHLFMDDDVELTRQGFTKGDVFCMHSVEHVIEQLKQAGFQHVAYQKEDGYFIQCEK